MSISRRDWLRLSAVGAALPFLPIPGFATHRSDNPIRLHSNENPYAPAQSARTAVVDALNETNLYAGSAVAQNLEAMIAAREGLRPEHVVLGAGSTEVLRMAALAYGLSGGEVVTGYPTYEGMETSAKSIQARVHRVPLKSDKSLDLSAMDMRTTKDVKLVFVCNPNNPTGSICDKEELNDFCLEVSKRCTILVDEAYYELVNHSRYSTAVPLVKAGANVIVSRTFSKVYGLAGLRVGYAIARPDIAERLRTHRTPMAVNILGLRAAIASLNDERFLHYSKTQLEAGRNQITAALRGWGHEVIESHTNFVFFHLGRGIEEFQRSMASQGILVGRPFPPFLDWCRLSIGNEEEMARFTEVFPKVMSSSTRY